MIQQFDSLMQMMEVFSDEQVCIDHLGAIRWKNGAYWPHCGSTKIYHFSGKRTHKCDIQCEDFHWAPRSYVSKAKALEDACRFIAAMRDQA